MGASGGVDSQCSNWNRIRRTDLIHHRINHKALETLAMATTPATTAVHQVNLPFSYYHRSKGTSLPRRRRGANVHTRRVRFVHSPNWKKHKLCLSTPTSSQPEGPTTSLQSASTDDNGTPATWTLVLSSSKPLTGRTGHKLKDASTTGTTGDTPFTGTLPLPDKDSSQRRHALLATLH